MEKQTQANASQWERTAVQNLYRRQPSGNYYALAKVGGKQQWKSLRTNRLADARVYLADWLKEQRARARLHRGDEQPALTFREAVLAVQERNRANPDHRPATRTYHEQCAARVLKLDSKFTERRLRDITDQQWQEWTDRLRGAFSAWTYNKGLGLARRAIAVGIRRGAIRDDPIRALEIRGRQAQLRAVELPSNTQFRRLVDVVRGSGSGFARPCGDLIELLAFTGLRLGESNRLVWGDIDLDSGRLTVRIAKTEAGTGRVVPLIPDAKALLSRMRDHRGHVHSQDPVCEVHECQKALDRGCRIAKCQRLTHHDLRRLFTTRCIESGVDIPTAARWLGHVDGGALLMRVYGRLRVEHSEQQARAVTFAEGGGSA